MFRTPLNDSALPVLKPLPVTVTVLLPVPLKLIVPAPARLEFEKV